MNGCLDGCVIVSIQFYGNMRDFETGGTNQSDFLQFAIS
jgi:hypothetical protein